MTKIHKATNIELDSEYKIEQIDGVKGLILESWGPSTRNPDYNEALDIILERLTKLHVPYISINVISKSLLKALPEPEQRQISINGTSQINLIGIDAKKLRLEIGQQQANLKVNPETKGGNRTKRILLHNPNIDLNLWEKIAKGAYSTAEYSQIVSKVTSDHSELENKVQSLLSKPIAKPEGETKPKVNEQSIRAFERDPKVKVWVLQNSKGKCEACLQLAPFMKEGGTPYLEVHHLLPLSEGGSDTITNTVAVCPNCHMALHYSKDKILLRDEITTRLTRILSEI